MNFFNIRIFFPTHKSVKGFSIAADFDLSYFLGVLITLPLDIFHPVPNAPPPVAG
jgi:hypothetical protein